MAEAMPARPSGGMLGLALAAVPEGAGVPAPSSPAPAETEAEKMRKVLADSGIPSTDPIYPILLASAESNDATQDLIKTVRDLVDAHNNDLRSCAEAEAEQAVAYIREVEQDSIARLAQAVEDAGRRVERGRQWGAVAKVAAGALAVGAVLGGMGLWVGWEKGRASRDGLAAELAEAFRYGPEAAERWLHLIERNNPTLALVECKGEWVWFVEGRRACRVPLYIDGAR